VQPEGNSPSCVRGAKCLRSPAVVTGWRTAESVFIQKKVRLWEFIKDSSTQKFRPLHLVRSGRCWLGVGCDQIF
jgi:hypothetical protein